MSYIDTAIIDDGATVIVWEKVGDDVITKKYPAEYYYYLPKTTGTQKTIFPDRFSNAIKVSFTDRTALKNAVEQHYNSYPNEPLFESDITPDLRVLADHYYQAPAPTLNVSFLDIETDADLKNKGWPTMDNPYGSIISVAMYHQWKKETVLITLPSEGAQLYTPEELGCDRIIYCQNEFDLLVSIVKEVQESNVLSGWNSSLYDLPYIMARLGIVLPTVIDNITQDEISSLLCRDGITAKKKEFPSKFGNKTEVSYQLYGRVSLDYKDLYEKFTFEELQSYSLESVADHELGYGKVKYSGTLPELYRKDYKTFLKYNIHDVVLLRDLDAKLNFIRLLNEMAHDCSCRFQDVLGTVVMSDQALMAWAHHKRGQVIPDKGANVGIPEYISTAAREDSDRDKYAGAFVYDMDSYDDYNRVISTKRGVSDYIGSVDITSLYPNTMISNNISIETLIWNADRAKGDILWADRMNYYRDTIRKIEKEQQDEDIRSDSEKKGVKLKRTRILLDAEDTDDWSQVELNESYSWGARNDIVGLVPEILSYWFDQRLILKKKLKEAAKNKNDILKKHGIDTKKPPKPEKLKEMMPEEDFNQYLHWKAEAENFDRLQHVKKIQLNALYGAIGNKYSHFYNLACAEACTLGGQGITQHMIRTIANILDGDPNLRSKVIQYADTDSCYFKILDAQNDDEAILVGNYVGEETNKTFADYMKRTHNCNDLQASRIAAAREVISDKSIFIGKKYYAMHLIDKEGERVDKLKIMGLSAIKSDTPLVVKNMLKEVLTRILRDKQSEKQVAEFIVNFRNKLYNEFTPLDFGIPKGINGLEDYEDRLKVRAIYEKDIRGGNVLLGEFGITKEEKDILKKAKEDQERWDKIIKGKTVFVPGHVRAAINWNLRLNEECDKITPRITSGMKIKTFYLKNNRWGYTSIAIPTDIDEIPKWFSHLPFDMAKIEETIIDKKLETIYHPIGWKIPKEMDTNDGFVF